MARNKVRARQMSRQNPQAGTVALIRASLHLLEARDRRRLMVFTAIQALVALVDMVGVLLLGLTAALATTAVTGATLPVGNGLLSRLGVPQTPDVRTVAVLAAFAGCALITKSLLSLIVTRQTFRFLASRQAHISTKVARELFDRPYLFVSSRSSQETAMALAGGVSSIALGVIGQSMILVAEALLLAVLFVGVVLVNPLVAVFTAVFFGLLAYVLVKRVGGHAKALGKVSFEAEVESLSVMQGALLALREITVLGRKQTFIDRFAASREMASHALAETFMVSQLGKYVFEIGLVVGGGLLVGIMAFARDLTTAVATLTVFLVAAARVVPSLLRIQSALVVMNSSQGTALTAFALFDDLANVPGRRANDLVVKEGGVTDPNFLHGGFLGTLDIDHVTLAYSGSGINALNNVSANVSAGGSLAIVGATGAGKSSLADVVLGVIEPTSGSVLISGMPPHLAAASFPGAISYVPQTIAVLPGTIRDNVALGLPRLQVSDELVWAALERAQLADFLATRRDGLDTPVGEHGFTLSGGQKQRLGIARGLYSRPRFLVLDEATSALDADTEQAISNVLEELSGQLTLVVVAHRLSTVRTCDQVMYLEDGVVRGLGTFEEVRRVVPDFNRQADLLGL